MNSSVKESWVSESGRGADAYEAWVDKLMTAQGADWCPGKTPPGAPARRSGIKLLARLT